MRYAKRKQLIVLAAMPICLTFVAAANAQTTLFDSTGGAVSSSIAVADGPNIYGSFSTDISSYTLTDVKLDMYNDSPAAGTINVGLYADNSTSPGTLIDALGSFSEASVGLGTTIDVPVGITVDLSPNSTYWIGLTGGTSGGAELQFTGDNTGTGVRGEFYTLGSFTNDNGDPVVPMMMVIATDSSQTNTPEPGAIALLSGMVVVGGSLARRRRKIRG